MIRLNWIQSDATVIANPIPKAAKFLVAEKTVAVYE